MSVNGGLRGGAGASERGAGFGQGTPIRLANGGRCPIEALREGAWLSRADGHAAELLELVESRSPRPLLTLVLNDGAALSLTPDQPVLVAGPGRLSLLPAGRVQVGDRLTVCRDGLLLRAAVAELRGLPAGGLVYSLRLIGGLNQPEHLLLAGDVVAGDLFLHEWTAGVDRSDLSLGTPPAPAAIRPRAPRDSLSPTPI